MGEFSLPSKLTAEFIGTFLLVFTVGCNTVLQAAGTHAALSIASVLMVSIYALGTVSGAHFNPAVSVACFLHPKGESPPMSELAAYIVTQLIAGCVAGGASYFLHGNAMNLEPGKDFGMLDAGCVEFLYTFMLCLVVLRVAVHNPANTEYFGLAIGFVIVAGGYAGGFVSCGAFNPAVALGVDVGSAGQGVYWSFVYWFFEILGAAAAAGVSSFMGPDGPDKTIGQKCVSEFLGTFFLVYTVGLNVLGGSPAPALSIAASLMCMIYALGPVSGGHFNPAVTFALTCSGDAPTGEFAWYVVSQCLGGLVAGGAYAALLGETVPLQPGGDHSWMHVGLAETIYTFLLCFVVLCVACPSALPGKSTHFFGLAIGFCVVAGGYAIGSISGGSLNPAVSFGLDTSAWLKGASGYGNFALYTGFELLGGGLAFAAFNGLRGKAKAGFLRKTDGYGAV